MAQVDTTTLLQRMGNRLSNWAPVASARRAMSSVLPLFARRNNAETEGLFDPYRRNSIGGSYSAMLNSRGLFSDDFGWDSWLGELGKFNPLAVNPFIQVLMRRSVMPRMALIILGSALTERQYVVEGSTPEIEAFHQRWIDRMMPRILRSAVNAIWYGWQPFILDWGVDQDGMILPIRANDVDPFHATARHFIETGSFAGITVDGQTFDEARSLALTWEGQFGDVYGEGQCNTVYPYWYAHSVMLVWCMRYYERSVDPVRVGFAKNIKVATGRQNADGTPEKANLADVLREVLDLAANGDSLSVPIDEAGADAVRIDTLEMPDRADTWLKMLGYLEQKQLLGAMSLPGIGLGGVGGEIGGQDARTAEKFQLRVLEHASNMPLEALNSTLIPMVHKVNRLPGPIPTLRGKAFKREQQEMLSGLLQTALNQPVPQVGPDGRPTGSSYRPADLIKFDRLGRALDIPMNEVVEVARAVLEPQAPGVGGRPEEPLNDDPESSMDVSRAEARRSGREDR